MLETWFPKHTSKLILAKLCHRTPQLPTKQSLVDSPTPTISPQPWL